MRILIAPDKFKLTLTAMQVAEITGNILREHGHEVLLCPLADGGEGTFELLTQACNGSIHQVAVSDPLGRNVNAQFGISPEQSTAFIDMSQAAGLFRLTTAERNPELTNTFGVGELILEAIRFGAAEIILGCGGSATNDGGTGMAAALGYRFLDANGVPFIPVGGTLDRIARIDASQVIPELDKIRFTVISDVTNPFSGPEGAAVVFAPQKGADDAAVHRLDHGLVHLARLFEQRDGFLIDAVRGAGAGGGFTGGAAWFLHAQHLPGAAVVMDRTGFFSQLSGADLVITGEGRLDEQSLHGKVVSEVAAACRVRSVPFHIVCGQQQVSQDFRLALGAQEIWSLSAVAGSTAQALENPEKWLESVIESLCEGLK
ncbi:MAG: glycerate kinase [Bacteroidota bacterium]